jgi:TatD DNase family protein
LDLVDIGANLTHRDFRKDLPEVIARARQAGVTQVVVTGTSAHESRGAQALAERFPGTLFATAGVHPHDARSWGPATLRTLEELLGAAGVVALGETGLDFYRDYSPRPAQERAFEAQLELAAERGAPVFLHERGAHAQFLALLARYRHGLPRAVVHCFTGTRDELWAYLDLDLHIGVTGWICDERRGAGLREVIGHVPPGRLMIESDAPYLLPRTLGRLPGGRRNEPAFLPEVLAAVAAARAAPAADLARSTTATARAFFGLATPARPA